MDVLRAGDCLQYTPCSRWGLLSTTVQAAVEKEAKGLQLGKTYTECLMKSSGKFKLAAGCGMSAVFAVFSRFYRDGW